MSRKIRPKKKKNKEIPNLKCKSNFRDPLPSYKSFPECSNAEETHDVRSTIPNKSRPPEGDRRRVMRSWQRRVLEGRTAADETEA